MLIDFINGSKCSDTKVHLKEKNYPIIAKSLKSAVGFKQQTSKNRALLQSPGSVNDEYYF